MGTGSRSASNSIFAATSSSSVLKGNIPNFDGYKRREAIAADYPTVYSRYKNATNRFFQYMREKTPASVVGGNKSINFLVTAADWMVESNHVMDPMALQDLKSSIRVRSRIARHIFGGGDKGHAHLIKVLKFCWALLVLLPRAERPAIIEEEESEENRFAALGIENEDEDEEDEEMFPSSPIPRPATVDEVMTLEDLMASDDRRDSIIFLLTLNELMGAVSEQYKAISQCMKSNRRMGVPMSSMVENLIESAVATNMAIQQVQQLEMELQLQHTHLTTPYRLLSTLILPQFTTELAKIVREHASRPCSERDIATFLGDCIECFFRNPSDECNQRDTIVQNFCSRYEVNSAGSDEIQLNFKMIEQTVLMEVPIGPEIAGKNRMVNVMQSLVPVSHSWLQNMDFIGGGRAIHHTLRLLQMFGSVISSTPLDKKIEPKRGWFGSTPFRADRVHKICGDLDEVFMSDILPQWVLLCRQGILGKLKLPNQDEICPLFVLLQKYVENPGKPISWSIAFGVHAVLTGMLESIRDSNELMSLSKTSFHLYFQQVDWAVKVAQNEPEMKRNPAWSHNTTMVSFLENLGLDIYGRYATWNPVFGGSIFSYLCFFANLEGGCAVLDCQAQLRITLHLYHGLLINGIIRKGQIPVLDYLYDSFKKSRAIWEGSLPHKRELVKKFWICFGMGMVDSNRMAEKAKNDIRNRVLSLSTCFSDEAGNASWNRRKMKPLEPSEIATCFRRICNRDFNGVIDKYHTCCSHE